MKNNATVSVAIATYNRAAMVRQAVEAALRQTRPPDEIVVADDASTDSTWAVLNEMAAGEPRLKIFRRRTEFGGRGELELRDRDRPPAITSRGARTTTASRRII